jgi:hypothetical protein
MSELRTEFGCCLDCTNAIGVNRYTGGSGCREGDAQFARVGADFLEKWSHRRRRVIGISDVGPGSGIE